MDRAPHAVEGCVSHDVLSIALDEIYYLRAGCAYEVGVLRATLATKIPHRARNLLAGLVAEHLAPAARGRLYMMPSAADVTVCHDLWERQRGLHHLDTNSARGVPESLYDTAVTEIFMLRQAMATTADGLDDVLAFKSLPLRSRHATESQVNRLTLAGAGQFAVYQDEPSETLLARLREVGAKEHLTTPGFAAEVEARWIG